MLVEAIGHVMGRMNETGSQQDHIDPRGELNSVTEKKQGYLDRFRRRRRRQGTLLLGSLGWWGER